METDYLLAPLFFVVLGLVAGAVLKSLLKKSSLPYTVVLFCVGILLGLLDRFGILSDYEMFKSAIDFAGNLNPDMILYLFLPVLIFDGAYELDLHVFKKSLFNSTLLAGPGIAISMFIMAAFVMGLAMFVPECKEWNWNYALMFGALIGATDPVAVVALLKELGTSKRFSTLVDAESMLNDGTGIVLFMLFFSAYTAMGGDTSSPLMRILIVVVGGTVLGWALARFTIWSLGQVGGDESVQNSAIIVGAYITFIVAQSFLNVSGVIALVAFGLTISYVGRPQLKPEVHRFMQSFWELAAYMANTLIFIIVGVVIALKVDVTWTNVLLLIAVYVGVNLARAAMVLLLYPIMKKCGYGLTMRESVILVWGGLRGALCMTLALMVSYTPAIPEEIRRQILFFTAGIVTLTLTINATTMRWLLLKLGLTRIPSAKMLLDYTIKQSLADNSEKYLESLKKREALEISDWKLVESFMPKKDKAPDVSFKPEDMLADIRLRVLNKERALCWNMYDEGIVSFVTLRCLTASIDELYDHSGRLPLSYRKRIFEYYDNSFYIRLIKKLPIARKWLDVYFHDRVVTGYDLARGFVIVQKKSIELIKEFENSDVLMDQEKEQLVVLKDEINSNLLKITEIMDYLSTNYPVSFRCGVTRKSIRMLLANEHRQIESFQNEGLLTAKEARAMIDDLDERHASISDLTTVWKNKVKAE